MNNYPEHNKLKSIDEQDCDLIQNFIDWLYDETDLHVCELNLREDRMWGDEYFPTYKSREQIMADYFGIDLKKLSKEKDQMLNEWREAQGL